MIRLIVSDLDGTLLLDGSQELPEGICGRIRELKKKGILFAAASGRQYANLRRLFAPVQEDIAYICENGCLVYYRGKLIYKAEMDRETGQEILRAIMEEETAEALLSGEDTSYIQPKDPEYRYHLEQVVKNNVTVVPDILETREPYFKISVYEKEGLEAAGSYWEERFSNRVTVVTSGNEWLDMMPPEVNKGRAFEILLEHLGIRKEECMVFGDNYNDVEMLELAGFDFAMDSAGPDIRRLCGWHTDTVGHALEEFLSKGERMLQDDRWINNREDRTRRTNMSEYSKMCLETFLKDQGRLFDEPVAETLEEASEFLEECMAVVVKNLKEVRSCLDESGMDVETMTDQELLEASEVFPLADGTYLIVEG